MNSMANHWWMLVVRGFASLALAMFLLTAWLVLDWPFLPTVAAAFGVYAILDGAVSLGFALRRGATGLSVARGQLGALAGIAAIAYPAMGEHWLALVIAAWAVGSGLLEMAFGSKIWSLLPSALGFMLAGTLSLGLGLTVLTFPLGGALMLLVFITFYAAMNAIASTAMGMRIHADQLRAQGA